MLPAGFAPVIAGLKLACNTTFWFTEDGLFGDVTTTPVLPTPTFWVIAVEALLLAKLVSVVVNVPVMLKFPAAPNIKVHDSTVPSAASATGAVHVPVIVVAVVGAIGFTEKLTDPAGTTVLLEKAGDTGVVMVAGTLTWGCPAEW